MFNAGMDGKEGEFGVNELVGERGSRSESEDIESMRVGQGASMSSSDEFRDPRCR